MQQQKVRLKILLTTLLPTVLISLLLSAYFLNTRNNELDQVFLEKNFNLIEKLGPIAQTYLANDQIAALQSLAANSLEEPNVKSILIYDQHKRLLAQAGPAPASSHPKANDRLSKSKNIARATATILFSQPIKSDPWLDHLYPANTASQNKLGWIEVESYTLQKSLEKYRLLFFTSIGVLLTWLTHALWVFRASNRASDSLQSLYHAIIAIKEGKLNVRVKFQGVSELKKLELEFNAMSRSIRSARHDLQLDVEQASENVRETLETIEIQNIELDMARKEALEASRIKSEFLANMSHEIRTPLNGIIGFTKLLLKSHLTPRQQDHVSTINKSSDGLLAIINDILDFSKIEAGKLELDHTPLNLREVVEEVLTMLSPLAHEKNLEEIAIIYSDVPINLIGDPLRLKQIITNLVNNAIKFTEQGSVIVRVMLEDQRSQRDQQVYIRISVSDSGIGLSPDEQKDLFQAFSQSKSPKMQQYGGSGLGLVISKHLTEQMGGEIGLESKQGEGSTFWFTFCAEQDTHNDELIDAQLFQHNRIAVFDQHEMVRLSLSHMLQRAQIQHEQFDDLSTLRNAIENANQTEQPFSAALIGVNHNHENNTTLLKSVQEIEQALHCRTVVLANTSDQTKYQNLLEQASNTYLTKPVSLKKLLITLSNTPVTTQENQISFSEKRLYQSAPQKNAETLNILAVDDNPTNLKLVCTLLQEMGIRTTGCDSGKEAIRLHQKHSYDLILMDVRMPEMGGIETTALIRKGESQDTRTPIIAVTAHAMANEKRQLLAQGMDDYVTKPINETLLQHIIDKWLLDTPKQAVPALQTLPDSNRPPMNEATSHHIVDLKEGTLLAGGKKELAQEMLTMLFNTLEADKRAIINSASNHDQLIDKVHHLHGATRYCGVPELKFHANKVETLLKQNRKKEAQEALQDFLQAIDRALQWWHLNQVTITGAESSATTSETSFTKALPLSGPPEKHSANLAENEESTTSRIENAETLEPQ